MESNNNSINHHSNGVELGQQVNKYNETLAIDIKHAYFSYNKKNPVLKDVNLQIPKGLSHFSFL